MGEVPIYLTAWVAAKSVRLFVNKQDRQHFLAILGEELSENLSLATQNKKFQEYEGEKEVEGEREKVHEDPATGKVAVKGGHMPDLERLDFSSKRLLAPVERKIS